MNTRMNNEDLKFIAELQESNWCKYTMDDEDHRDQNSNSMRSKDDENAMIRMTCMLEVQQTVIDNLTKKMNQIEVEMKVQSFVAAREMASMRSKCEISHQRPQVFEDNPTRNRETAWNILVEENASLKREHFDLRDELNSLKLKLAERNETFTDSCVVKLAGIDDELQNTDTVVDTIVQANEVIEVTKVDEVNKDHMINESAENGVSHGLLSLSTTSAVETEVELITQHDVSKSNATVPEIVESPTSLPKPVDSYKETVELRAITELKTVHVQEPPETEISTVDDTNKYNHEETVLDEAMLNSKPINLLQEWCISRSWKLPEYEFFEFGLKSSPVFLVECTLLRYKFKAEGSSKKEGKRLAAIGMYRIVVNHVTENVPSEKKTSERYEPGKKSNLTGMVPVDACFSSSAKCHEKPAVIPDVIDAPTAVAAIESGDVNGNVPLQVAMVNDDKTLLSFSPEHAEFADRLRLSNNPAMRKLKEIGSLNQSTDYTEFLVEIADEEQLTMFYDLCITPATLKQDLVTVELTISPLEITVIGYGESAYEAQKDAAYAYLTRFKLMLKI